MAEKHLQNRLVDCLNRFAKKEHLSKADLNMYLLAIIEDNP